MTKIPENTDSAAVNQISSIHQQARTMWGLKQGQDASDSKVAVSQQVVDQIAHIFIDALQVYGPNRPSDVRRSGLLHSICEYNVCIEPDKLFRSKGKGASSEYSHYWQSVANTVMNMAQDGLPKTTHNGVKFDDMLRQHSGQTVKSFGMFPTTNNQKVHFFFDVDTLGDAPTVEGKKFTVENQLDDFVNAYRSAFRERLVTILKNVETMDTVFESVNVELALKRKSAMNKAAEPPEIEEVTEVMSEEDWLIKALTDVRSLFYTGKEVEKIVFVERLRAIYANPNLKKYKKKFFDFLIWAQNDKNVKCRFWSDIISDQTMIRVLINNFLEKLRRSKSAVHGK